MDIDVGDLSLQLKDKALFKQKCFIGGKWEEADNGEKFEVINPSNSSVVGTMPNVGKNETIKAIEAANNALIKTPLFTLEPGYYTTWKNQIGNCSFWNHRHR